MDAIRPSREALLTESSLSEKLSFLRLFIIFYLKKIKSAVSVNSNFVLDSQSMDNQKTSKIISLQNGAVFVMRCVCNDKCNIHVLQELLIDHAIIREIIDQLHY